jgi:hypothetical protein
MTLRRIEESKNKESENKTETTQKQNETSRNVINNSDNHVKHFSAEQYQIMMPNKIACNKTANDKISRFRTLCCPAHTPVCYLACLLVHWSRVVRLEQWGA